MALEIASDKNIGVYADNNRMASYKYLEGGITEVTFISMFGEEWVGHINQFEKADGMCLHFVETGSFPSGWYRVGGACRCKLCKAWREIDADMDDLYQRMLREVFEVKEEN